ncbi:MAG: arginine--tRNA ligase [Bacteroidia bacterium]|nr:arginine--tRNA ligase [Bacteroidia bacterium]
MTLDPQALLQHHAAAALAHLYGQSLAPESLTVQTTAAEFEGDLTLVLFPLLKLKLGSPEALGQAIGDYLVAQGIGIARHSTVKGFLNVSFADSYWAQALAHAAHDPQQLWYLPLGAGQRVMVEFSSPNTNKPLHLGHLRNNFLGDAISRLYQAAGYAVVKANLVNDRGVHICKSMWAWQQYGQGDVPGPERKGDHLVGDYYVRFEQTLKAQAAELMAADPALSLEEARKRAPATLAVQEMLRQWEAADPEVRALWQRMNGWVYQGFEATYRRMGIAFDQYYYESDTYLLGKDILDEGLATGVFYRRPDGSVWVDLTAEGLDEKLLLRADGTSVYMTQDLGTADLKYRDHAMHRSVYVVGNEQDYHFKVLFSILKKLGRPYAQGLYHLSYGMVELPSGKMKSREGTVVDADDLMAEVVQSAQAETTEKGKVSGLSPDQLETLYETLGLGALKFYLLKVQPHKKMLYDPAESVSLQGDTGPFVQYTHARIRSLLYKAAEMGLSAGAFEGASLSPEERAVVQRLLRYPHTLREAVQTYDPSAVVNYLLDLAKDYNRFYYAHPVLREDAPATLGLRLTLSRLTADTLREGMGLLGIGVPDRM